MRALKDLLDSLAVTLVERAVDEKSGVINMALAKDCINESPTMVTVHSFKAKPFFLFLNDKTRDFYGYESNDCSKMNISFYAKTFHPKSLSMLVHTYQFFYSDRRDYLQLTYQLRNAAGSYEKVYGVSKTISWTEKGAPAYVLSLTCREADWNELNAICSYGLGGIGERPRECLKWLLRGKTNAQIASEMSISEKTVEKHVDLILKTSQFSSRRELIKSCVEQPE